MSDEREVSDTFIKELYDKVLMCVKASNALAMDEEEYHYNQNNSAGFAKKCKNVLRIVYRNIQGIQRTNGTNVLVMDDDVKGSLIRKAHDAVEQRELEIQSSIADFVDHLLEEAERGIALFQSGQTTPVATAALVKDTEPQPHHGNPFSLEKPQRQFSDVIDISEAPWIPKVLKKYHAITPYKPDFAGVDPCVHPYHDEIKALESKGLPAEEDAHTNKLVLPSLACPCTWIATKESLDALLTTLMDPTCSAFAVDLEHHSFRSYQGFLCLMQISTMDQDFLVDTIALRSELHILNQVFCDPSKLKVFHGADSDILWLQRDLGIYVVRMFDTGQAARVLDYPGFSLAYLLKLHCAITVDKQYQLADWRLRPLTNEMTKYARQDTRYLLYVYHRMKQELWEKSANSPHNLVSEVFTRSNAIALQVYSKPTWSMEQSKLTSMKLQVRLSPQQSTVFHAVHRWRDEVARKEDESIGYVLPNAFLARIAKNCPTSSFELSKCFHKKYPMVEKYFNELYDVIASARDAEVDPIQQQPQQEQQQQQQSMDNKDDWTDSKKSSFEVDTRGAPTLSALFDYPGWTVASQNSVMENSDATNLTTQLVSVFGKVEAEEFKNVSEQKAIYEAIASVSFRVRTFDPNVSMKTEPSNQKGGEVAMRDDFSSVLEKTNSSLYTIPKSISENYKLTEKKKKSLGRPDEAVVDASLVSNDVIHTHTAPSSANQSIKSVEITSEEKSKESDSFEPFDYTAAGKRDNLVDACKITSIAEHADAKCSTDKTHRAKKKVAGYNPFIASSSAAASSNTRTGESSAAYKKRKPNGAPRAMTFT